MKRFIVVTIIILAMLGVIGQAAVIWNFDSPASMPSSIAKLGGFYVYLSSTTAGKGIGGSNALDITVPSSVRTWGGGFQLNASPALNLTGTPFLYGWISADSTNPFGVAFEVKDTTGGYQFIPPPGPYTAYAQKFAGTINASFKKVEFDLRTFDRYGAGTGAPNLGGITQIGWIFPDNTGGSTGPFHFYLDNIGAGTIPVELIDFSADIAK